MAKTDESTKMYQSQAITRIGCIGLVFVVILLALIGGAAIRADLGGKRASAMTALARMHEQIEKAPGVLQRMVAFGCGSDAEEAVRQAAERVGGLDVEAPVKEQDEVWEEVEAAWVAVTRGYAAHLAEPALVDLTTEMEGIRNRRSVERGNYKEAAEVYNEALGGAMAGLFAWGMEPL